MDWFGLFLMYFSNSCVNQELVLKRKKLSQDTGTVQPDQNPTCHSVWLKSSGLLFRDTLIFPLTIHRQASKNPVSSISPLILWVIWVLCSRSGDQVFGDLEESLTFILLWLTSHSLRTDFTCLQKTLLVDIYFYKKKRFCFLGYFHPESAYIKTQLHFFRFSESKPYFFPMPFSLVQKVRNILVLILKDQPL